MINKKRGGEKKGRKMKKYITKNYLDLLLFKMV